jgi:ribonuclease Y
MLVVVAIVIGVAAGIAGTFVTLRLIAGSRLDAARRERNLLLDEARRDAEVMRREAGIEGREQAIKLRADLEAELRGRRDQVVKIEERVIAKEDDIDRKLSELIRREQGVSDREIHLRQLQEEMKELKDAHRRELERIAGMTRWRRRPPRSRSGVPVTSSPTRSSGSPRAPRPRPRSRSSSFPPTT